MQDNILLLVCSLWFFIGTTVGFVVCFFFIRSLASKLAKHGEDFDHHDPANWWKHPKEEEGEE